VVYNADGLHIVTSERLHDFVLFARGLVVHTKFLTTECRSQVTWTFGGAGVGKMVTHARWCGWLQLGPLRSLLS
jgi:hypothetical protein